MPCIGADPQADAREPLWLGKGLVSWARAVAVAIRIAFSGYSTPPSRGPRRGPRAGWKARATSLFPRLPLSPQDSISIPSIFRIGDLTFANSVQHAAVRFPHYQCPQQFSRCLRALVIERLRWTRGRSSLLDFDWCDGECKAQAQACRSHEPPPRFGVRPAGREQHVCRRERWVPESVCIRLATLTT
mmetsp:Transcript_65480/g.195766  ORF Transcript_65480/g.195766 Transcript_65480/m.195766 type:complete len:187 (+) Transcript_65480:122-682(+)